MTNLQPASFTLPEVVYMPIQQLSKAEAGALLRERREALRLTQEQVITEAGIPTLTQLSEYENGKVSVARSKYLPALAQALRLTEDDVRAINPSAVFDLPDPRPHAQDGAVPLLSDGMVEVPVYGLATASPDGMVSGVPLGMARVPPQYARREHMHAYAVLGDSMDDGTRDGIRDGDRIVCNHADTDLQEGKIYVVKVPGNGILLKRVRAYEDGELYLASDNARYRPLPTENAQILGRVVWVDPAGYVPS